MSVTTAKEEYQLLWPGKADAINRAHTPPSGFSNPSGLDGLVGKKDVFIEGDNMDALKILCRQHSGAVDVIYIDPPYNSGKNFVYRNSFYEGENAFSKRTGSIADITARRHSLWLSMMLPRIILARRLLSDRGVMFVSIDDAELHNLLMIMNEVFGEENRAGVITWVKKKKGSHLSKSLRCITEYVAVFAKDIKKVDLYGEDAYTYKWQPLIKRVNKEKVLYFDAGTVETTLKKPYYPKGVYGKGGTKVELLDDVHIQQGKIVNAFSIKARTVWTQKKLDEEIALGTRVSIRSEKMGPNVFRHDQLSKIKRPPTLLDHNMKIGTNEDAWNEMRAIFGTHLNFAYPKPLSLIKYLMDTVTHRNKKGLCLDFFAGTGTTGHAVWQLNREDNGSRRFILVQSPEPLSPKVTLTDGMELETMAQLCMERLERVGDGESLERFELKKT